MLNMYYNICLENRREINDPLLFTLVAYMGHVTAQPLLLWPKKEIFANSLYIARNSVFLSVLKIQL